MASEILRNENGAVWAYAVKKSGVVSKAGSRISQDEADARVARGESEWEQVKASAAAPVTRQSYADHVRDLADRNPSAVQPRDWSIAMNRDD